MEDPDVSGVSDANGAALDPQEQVSELEIDRDVFQRAVIDHARVLGEFILVLLDG